MMRTEPNLIVASLLGFLPLWLFSALLHLADGVVGDIQALTTPDMLVSVTGIAMFLSLPMLLPVAGFVKRGKLGFALGLMATSALLTVMLALGGAAATTLGQWLITIGGLTVLCGLVFGLAALPVAMVLAARDREAPSGA